MAIAIESRIFFFDGLSIYDVYRIYLNALGENMQVDLIKIEKTSTEGFATLINLKIFNF